MSTHKHVDLICVAVLVCTVLLTLLFVNGSRFGVEIMTDGDSDNSTDSVFFTRNDRNGDWDSSGATRITLAGDHASIAGGGAYVYNGDVIIAQTGRYAISGTLDDGSIVVSADGNSKVWILLNGAEIHCSDDACLRIDQADKVFLTLAAGSENSMSSGAEFSAAALEAKRSGTISSREDLTVNGGGSLDVKAAYSHGIDANDELVITGGALRIEAPGDAIHVNEGLRIEEAALTLIAGDEGINLQHEDTLLVISSGSLDIQSDGAGIKCANDLLMQDGALSIVSGADAVHCAGTVAVTDGAVTIDAGDDGIHSDKTVSISGGSLLFTRCYEGIEAPTIDVSGGDVEIYPSDDGMNANGGSGGFGFPGMFGKQTEASDGAEDEESWIHISGGSVTVVNGTARDADGLDSNGDIIITGGTVRVSLSANGSNSAIDYGSESGGVCEISGGEVVACGSYMMAEGFSDSSTQCSILYNVSYGADAGTTVSLEDAEGNVILSYTPPCSFSSVSLSSPEMKLGETYTVIIGDKEEQITLEEVSASYGDAKSGGFGGNMNWGGMRQRDDSERPRGGPPDGMGQRPDRPDSSAMPGPPEMGGTPPDWDGGTPDFSEMSAPPEMGGMTEPGAAQEETGTEGTAVVSGPQPVSAEIWTLLGACAFVLVLGILFAVKYRR